MSILSCEFLLVFKFIGLLLELMLRLAFRPSTLRFLTAVRSPAGFWLGDDLDRTGFSSTAFASALAFTTVVNGFDFFVVALTGLSVSLTF